MKLVVEYRRARRIEDDKRHTAIVNAIVEGCRAQGKRASFYDDRELDQLPIGVASIGGVHINVDDIANRIIEAEEKLTP